MKTENLFFLGSLESDQDTYDRNNELTTITKKESYYCDPNNTSVLYIKYTGKNGLEKSFSISAYLDKSKKLKYQKTKEATDKIASEYGFEGNGDICNILFPFYLLQLIKYRNKHMNKHMNEYKNENIVKFQEILKYIHTFSILIKQNHHFDCDINFINQLINNVLNYINPKLLEDFKENREPIVESGGKNSFSSSKLVEIMEQEIKTNVVTTCNTHPEEAKLEEKIQNFQKMQEEKEAIKEAKRKIKREEQLKKEQTLAEENAQKQKKLEVKKLKILKAAEAERARQEALEEARQKKEAEARKQELKAEEERKKQEEVEKQRQEEDCEKLESTIVEQLKKELQKFGIVM